MAVRVEFIKIGRYGNRTDDRLPARMQVALHKPVPEFLSECLVCLEAEVGVHPDPLYARFYGCRKVGRPKQTPGCALPSSSTTGLPDIIVGWAGDPRDFELTVYHELLHVVGYRRDLSSFKRDRHSRKRWDWRYEEAIEAKARKIVEARYGS